MKIGLLLWEGLTVAVIVFGAVAVFLLRRWLTGVPGEAPRGFWFRFTALLFGLCIIGLIEGVLLSSYGFGWFLAAMAVTLYVVAKIAPRLLNP
jgi:hypothetical protein